DIPVAFIKGISLAKLAYGNLGLRHNRDIDLVVNFGMMPAAAELLERAGYRRSLPPAAFSETQLQMWLLRTKELAYTHDEKDFEVELHSRLFDNHRLMPELPPASSWRRVPLTKKSYLCTLEEGDLFAYLCAHGAVDCWFRLKWLADIGALVAQQDERGVERLYLAAAARGAGRSAAQALLLCQRILGATLPDKLIATLSEDVSGRWLETIAMQSLTADLEPT